MEPESLNQIALWTLRIGCPLFLVAAGPRWRWIWSAMTAFVFASWLRWSFFYDQWSLEPTRISDIILGILKILVTVQVLSRLFDLKAHSHRVSIGVFLTLAGFLGGAVVAGRYGWSSGWDSYESAKLMLHAGLGMSMITGMSYRSMGARRLVTTDGLRFWGADRINPYIWRHGWLWLGYLASHVWFGTLPAPDDASWYWHQFLFRVVVISLLGLWLVEARRMVRPPVTAFR